MNIHIKNKIQPYWKHEPCSNNIYNILILESLPIRELYLGAQVIWEPNDIRGPDRNWYTRTQEYAGSGPRRNWTGNLKVYKVIGNGLET